MGKKKLRIVLGGGAIYTTNDFQKNSKPRIRFINQVGSGIQNYIGSVSGLTIKTESGFWLFFRRSDPNANPVVF